MPIRLDEDLELNISRPGIYLLDLELGYGAKSFTQYVHVYATVIVLAIILPKSFYAT